MPDSELFNGVESVSESHRVNLVLQLIERGSNRRFQFQKRGQCFIRAHNETPSVVAMCVNNPDCSPFGING
jgi:hypothetical protein